MHRAVHGKATGKPSLAFGRVLARLPEDYQRLLIDIFGGATTASIPGKNHYFSPVDIWV